ncbi:hypothetical protein NQK81_01510 [Amycolatopsis roodepoortensis]|uniref:hypothetical protein n=1 Tax=Amycolatopsis roodepoortensis TaxID=700274 RepID=UPI00214B9EEB|nr:hypothetical protein [Amycolatopsis roodepoortensis]UUV32153.1 hypothetical protein NQK81_01510 [Amycolatopsis roodepoortensis]
MDTNSCGTTIPRRTAPAVLAIAAAAILVAGCGGSRPWLTDDLLVDNGRFYVTCEDPADERHEKEVWLSPEQAADHTEGQPCPDGPLRTDEYWQEPDADRKRVTITRPARPATPPAGRTALSTVKQPLPTTKTSTTASKAK